MGLKTVIIQSVGTANYAVGKILSNILDVEQQLISKLLYCTPSVLVKEIEEEEAQKIESLLTQLGLIIKVQNSDEHLPKLPELFELAIYIEDVRKLHEVNKTLSVFLGCAEHESLKLLITDPSIVLGGVSFSTAQALQNRINAEVIISNPQKDLYTLKINAEDGNLIKEIIKALKSLSIQAEPNQRVFDNIDYQTSQKIWKKFQHTGEIQIINQSFQRFEILLEEFDIESKEQKACLTNEVGMPHNIFDVLLNNLPVILDESVDRKTLLEKLETYHKAGLKCSSHPLLYQDYKIIIQEIKNAKATHEVVKRFFPDVKKSEMKEKWITPISMNHLLTRYFAQMLEDVGCNVEIKRVD